MKRLLCLLLTAALLAGLIPAIAETADTQAVPLPSVGDVVEGFEVEEFRQKNFKDEGVLNKFRELLEQLKATFEKYNPTFIYYLLKSVRFTDIIERLGEGSNSRFVRIPHLKQIKFKIPDIKTQNDYGNLMKLLDEKHKLERKQIEINKKLQTAIIMDKLGDKYVKF